MYLKLSRILFLLLIFAVTQTPSVIATTSKTVSGTILETMDASGYTYMLIKTAQREIWVAIPATRVTKGEIVTYTDGMVMSNFHSKTLDKTFANIVFSPGLQGEKARSFHGSGPKKNSPQSDSFADAVKAEEKIIPPANSDLVSGGSAGAIVPFTEIEIEKASGENGYTIEEIFSKKDLLKGKTVRIKGKIVKYNPNIMGKNWIHLQDGTGNPMENTHDLVVTTTEQISSEKIIVIEGMLSANKDFGAGYTYEAIVEEATLLK